MKPQNYKNSNVLKAAVLTLLVLHIKQEEEKYFVCTWTSHQFLQMIKQSESFLIGHRGEGFIRVHLMQIWDQVCEDISRSKLFHL